MSRITRSSVEVWWRRGARRDGPDDRRCGHPHRPDGADAPGVGAALWLPGPEPLNQRAPPVPGARCGSARAAASGPGGGSVAGRGDEPGPHRRSGDRPHRVRRPPVPPPRARAARPRQAGDVRREPSDRGRVPRRRTLVTGGRELPARALLPGVRAPLARHRRHRRRRDRHGGLRPRAAPLGQGDRGVAGPDRSSHAGVGRRLRRIDRIRGPGRMAAITSGAGARSSSALRSDLEHRRSGRSGGVRDRPRHRGVAQRAAPPDHRRPASPRPRRPLGDGAAHHRDRQPHRGGTRVIGTPLVDEEHVGLADASGHVAGTAPKRSVHHDHTPLHHAFSCHVVDRSGRVLLARRAADKRTWPSTWSNACCGHPQLGETLREAVVRRLRQELGLEACRIGVAIPDFAYRAVMHDGTTEHELCPVLVAEVDRDPQPDPAEVDAVTWVDWTELRLRAALEPWSLSPWSVLQIEGLAELAPSPLSWLDRGQDAGALDIPIGCSVSTERLVGGVAGALGVERDAVEQRLRRFVRKQATFLTSTDDDVRGITVAVVDLVERGGKRLRPAFVHWGQAATGAEPDERVVTAAAAMELLHTFALLHDDVMDRSETRRGAPAAHVSLAGKRPGDASASEAAWFGTSAAILAGDLAYVWADQLFDAIGTGQSAERARGVFHQLRSEVIAGQYLDLRI